MLLAWCVAKGTNLFWGDWCFMNRKWIEFDTSRFATGDFFNLPTRIQCQSQRCQRQWWLYKDKILLDPKDWRKDLRMKCYCKTYFISLSCGPSVTLQCQALSWQKDGSRAGGRWKEGKLWWGTGDLSTMLSWERGTWVGSQDPRERSSSPAGVVMKVVLPEMAQVMPGPFLPNPAPPHFLWMTAFCKWCFWYLPVTLENTIEKLGTMGCFQICVCR